MSTIDSVTTLTKTTETALGSANASYENFRDIVKKGLESSTPNTSAISAKEQEAYETIRKIINNRKSKKKKEEGLKYLG